MKGNASTHIPSDKYRNNYDDIFRKPVDPEVYNLRKPAKDAAGKMLKEEIMYDPRR